MTDPHKNFGASLITNSPGTAGTTIEVTAGQSGRFAEGQNATVCPVGTTLQEMNGHAEIVRIVTIAGSVLTVERKQEGTAARNIVAGWEIFAGETAKTLTDVEQTIPVARTETANTTLKATDAGREVRMNVASGATKTVKLNKGTFTLGSVVRIRSIGEGKAEVTVGTEVKLHWASAAAALRPRQRYSAITLHFQAVVGTEEEWVADGDFE